jgi:hypothetical protein
MFLRVILTFIFSVLSVGQVFAQDESECIPYLRGKLQEMHSGAEQCGLSAGDMYTFPGSNPDQYECEAGGDVSSQLEAFQQCARVYTCAARFYNCAIENKNSGMDCRSAMNACTADNPVPQ